MISVQCPFKMSQATFRCMLCILAMAELQHVVWIFLIYKARTGLPSSWACMLCDSCMAASCAPSSNLKMGLW